MLLKSLKSFRKNDEGTITVLFAFSLLVIVMSVSLALDSALLRTHKAKLQATVDAALLFASHEGTANAEGVFEDVLVKLWESNGNDTTLEVLSFTENVQGIKTTITTVVTSDYEFIILDSFADTSPSLRARSQTEIEHRDVEVAIVLDISSSMNGQRINEAKVAARNFTETLLNDTVYNSETRISLVPFGGTVRLPQEMSYMVTPPAEGLEAFSQHWMDGEWNGCLELSANDVSNGIDLDSTYNVMEDFYTWTKNNPWCPRRGNEIVPLTGQKMEILDRIDSLTLSDGTGTDHGIMWGVETLNSQWANRFPYSNANVPAVSAPGVTKVVILMTDGGVTSQHQITDNRRTGNPPYKTRNPNRTRVSFGNSVGAFQAVCQRARNEGIIVYTIGYLMRNQNQVTTLSNCATSDNHHIDAESGDLNKVFNDIAHDLSPLRLTQ